MALKLHSQCLLNRRTIQDGGIAQPVVHRNLSCFSQNKKPKFVSTYLQKIRDDFDCDIPIDVLQKAKSTVSIL